MYSGYFFAAAVFFLFVIIVQLIRMNSFIIRAQKNKELLQQSVKEETEWQFIKGLY